MKRRYVLSVAMVVMLLLITGVAVLAEPADPPPPQHGPSIRIGVAQAAIVQGRAGAHNFVRPVPKEPPIFSVPLNTTVRMMAGAQGLWLGQAGGRLSARLEVYAVNAQGDLTLLAEDHLSATKRGPALEQRPLKVAVTFDRPGEVRLLVRLTAIAEPRGGESVQDVDEATVTVVVLDPATFGSISGRVTANDTDEGLADVPVTAGNRELRIHRTTRTDESGNYTLEKLPPGDYIVGVRPKDTAYVGELYDDATSLEEATPVTVGESEHVTGISFGLDRGGEISGRVTDAATGEPLAGIPIMVRPVRPAEEADAPAPGARDGRPSRPPDRCRPRPGAPPANPRHCRPRPAAVTAEDGTYTVQGLRAGEYKVAAVGKPQGYSVEFWEAATTPEEATPVAVELGQLVSGIDFTLEVLPH